MTVLNAEPLEVQPSEQHVASVHTESVGRAHGRYQYGEAQSQHAGYDTEPLLADCLTI
jgi:hypothetical protein